MNIYKNYYISEYVKNTLIFIYEAIITDINISTNAETDPAGENGPSVKELNLSLNYAGSITYEDVTFGQNGDMHWAYFGQIKQNV